MTGIIHQRAFIILMLAVFICAVSASAAGTTSVAKGDPYLLSGVVTGSPDTVAVWIFGQNYYRHDTASVDGQMYTYELSGGRTAEMAPGQYFVVIQHPMYNGQFDASPVAGAPAGGQTSVIATDGQQFVVSGPGALMGSEAAEALVNMLNSANIDDTYVQEMFLLEEPVFDASLSAEYPAGGTIVIEGTTNLAAGDILHYTFLPPDFFPTKKGETGNTDGASGTVKVAAGNPNRWTVIIDTSTLPVGSYILNIQSVSSSIGRTYTIELVTPPATSAATPAATTLPMTTVSAPPTTAPAESGPAAFASLAGALGAAALLIVYKKKE